MRDDGYPKGITADLGAALCAFPKWPDHPRQWRRVGPADEKGRTAIWASFTSRFELALALFCSNAAAPGTVSDEVLAEAYEVWGQGA